MIAIAGAGLAQRGGGFIVRARDDEKIVMRRNETLRERAAAPPYFNRAPTSFLAISIIAPGPPAASGLPK
jgi:hypothetical protein